ncbi:MAG: DUF1800 domain-containing protein [Bacteroidota bacterium]|nr:DUF1800 domain-containing protein [Bacteroidota bacterium]
MNLRRMSKCFTISIFLFALSAFTQKDSDEKIKLKFPYKKAGLTKREAAAHLLNRFTFGPTPGQIDEVVNMGLENWFAQQLNETIDDSDLQKRLAGYDALNLTTEQIVNTYPNPGQLIQLARKQNINLKNNDTSAQGKQEYKEQLKQFMQQNGYKPFAELERQLINQKILRAAYSNNQLQEVMTDFWFNHFNVSLTKPQCLQFTFPYERDAIRPNALGYFDKMLLATAKHPAMLEYLDNTTSVSNNNPLAQKQNNKPVAKRFQEKMMEMANDPSQKNAAFIKQMLDARKTQGLNENYAREIMELHTLGVDGGYTQNDVTQLARALTGWSVMPLIKDGAIQNLINKAGGKEKLEERGFVFEDNFLFRADKHDEGEKIILNQKLPANGGYAEGEKMIEFLANHPSTAKFISKKLATRFVSDHPSDALINKMATAFLQSKGNIKSVLAVMVNSDEFWKEDALREKIKSPFELAITAVRATKAEVQQPFQLFLWCTRMGQKFYYYQAPTGFPDKASYWINTGSLLNRMNFGLAFATEKIPGIKLNLAALNNNHEPESIEAALNIYSNTLLPERNNAANIKRLMPLINDNNLEKKLNNAIAVKDDIVLNERKNNNMIAQVVGVIIGSPEFQRK